MWRGILFGAFLGVMVLLIVFTWHWQVHGWPFHSDEDVFDALAPFDRRE